ncbi:PepSY domain-containing protein [Staphylococcus edaphicus]|uniref:PepSY domain-containing protein n=1 Tax=Staphylococcus edaphicus TaxID=1955013 RepID=A0A2C6WT12_9STAP|nr:PepSY domain-containing protein [Staphylococcus edaphicus]PHK50886.1 hypothetical protein BTJ66_00890 [Staphylococcus edaphicus]UQW82576.1 PepSY domain-containing protein [Staphylococcus edaphicus]
MLNKKSWFIISFISLTTVVGLICIYKRREHLQYQDPEKITSEVKTYFMNVIGSYILKAPITYTKSDSNHIAFQGGITTRSNDTLAYYDFYVDAKTGDILDIIEC